MVVRYGPELPRVLTPALAARCGVSRQRARTEVARGTWRRMAAGFVLTRPDEPSRLDWADAALTLAGPSAALSGWDALAQYGIAQIGGARILVLTRTGRSKRLGPVLVRRTDRPYAMRLTAGAHPLIPYFPLAPPARAVADTALLTPDLGTIRAMVARAIQLRVCSVDELTAELERCPRNGSGHLRTALAEISVGARSAAEAEALNQLRRSTLPEFEPNVPIVDERGELLFVVDVLWRRLRAALEVEGRQFHFEVDDWEATLDRHNALTGGRLSIVHYPPSRISKGDGLWLLELERWLRGRAAELCVPYQRGSSRRVLPTTPAEPMVLPGLTSVARRPRRASRAISG
jgi:hypothetical protein